MSPNPIKFLWTLAISKGIKRFIASLIALVGVSKLSRWGITIQQDALAAAVIGGLEVLRNWLKVKQGVSWL